jgi:excisionase family DNA binding protein
MYANMPRSLRPAVSDRLLTAADVAELLSVPVSWVREHTRSGRIPHVQLGRYVRYRRETVVGWVGEQEAGAFRRHRPQIPT